MRRHTQREFYIPERVVIEEVLVLLHVSALLFRQLCLALEAVEDDTLRLLYTLVKTNTGQMIPLFTLITF